MRRSIFSAWNFMILACGALLIIAGAPAAEAAANKAAANAAVEAKAPAQEYNLEEVPLNEGVDLTTEALDDGFFKDLGRLENLTYQGLFETAGALETDIQSAGELIDGEPSAQQTFSLGDIVYINKGSANGVTVGMQFGVHRVGVESVYHPTHGGSLGRMVTLEGILLVTEASVKISKTKVIQAYSSMERGDLINPYEKPVVPSFDPDKPVADKEVEGVIVIAKDPKNGMAKGDVVFLDVGAEKGVGVGDKFIIIDSRNVVRNDGRVVEGIPKIIGKVKVLSTREKTSTAIITASQMVIYVGDKVEYSPN